MKTHRAGIPGQNTAVVSVYSKLLSEELGIGTSQGLYTGVMVWPMLFDYYSSRFCFVQLEFGSVARVLGPLWCGFTVEHHLVIMTGFLVGMWAVTFVVTVSFLFILSMKHLVDQE
jgi:hypothetical protein